MPLGLLAGIALIGLWVTQCSGPRATVVGPPVVRNPEREGEPYVVIATAYNSGPGHGQVTVLVRLRDQASGTAYQQSEVLTLEAGETAQIATEFPVPRAAYQPEIVLSYPPG